MSDDIRDRLEKSLSEYVNNFADAKSGSDVAKMEAAFHHVVRMLSDRIREWHKTTIENAGLAAELSIFRPTRIQEPAAPCVQGFVYVATTSSPWVCSAKELRKAIVYPMIGKVDYHTHDMVTVCGKKVSFPIRERFTSGGWPRARELCSECVEKLGIQHMFKKDV